MISSTNFYISRFWLFPALWAFLLLWACAAGEQTTGIVRLETADRIAVMPIYNLTGLPAPLDDLHRELLGKLAASGADLVPAGELAAFITAHRLRHLGGIERRTAEALRRETGARTVLITALELYDTAAPPKIALSSRLVSTEPSLDLLWTGNLGMAGDDAPGLLALGLIEDPAKLASLALDRLASSVVRHLAAPQARQAPSSESASMPETVYRNPSLISSAGHRTAVLPFLNSSQRRNAGEIMALHFLRRLSAYPDFELLEPGAVRNALLEARVVMGDGISLADAQILFSRLDADLILSGQVLQYEDYQGETGKTGVCFSASLFERTSRKIAWNARSCESGDDGVWFFDFGRRRTAHDLADAMAQGAVQSLLQ